MLGRHELLKLGAGTLLATELPELSFAMRDPLKPLALNRLKIVVGASKPFGAIQVSDTHIARAVASDGKRKAVLAAERSFSVWGAHYLDEAVRLAKKRGDLLLHTGDLMDFVCDGYLEQTEGRFQDSAGTDPAKCP